MGRGTISSIFSGSTTLAGFVLVFLGIVIATYRSYEGDTPEHVLRTFKLSAIFGLVVFGHGLLVAAMALTSLSFRTAECFRWLTFGLFGLELALVLFLAVFVTVQMLRA